MVIGVKDIASAPPVTPVGSETSRQQPPAGGERALAIQQGNLTPAERAASEEVIKAAAELQEELKNDPSQVEDKVQKLQEKFPAESNVQLKAGYDPEGKDGFVIELVDRKTEQVYYRVPPESLSKLLNSDDEKLNPGSLLSAQS